MECARSMAVGSFTRIEVTPCGDNGNGDGGDIGERVRAKSAGAGMMTMVEDVSEGFSKMARDCENVLR